jgi:hypothetical protein
VEGGYEGEGNLDVDPFFADPGSGDYRLGPRSWCTDAGNSDALPPEITTDLDGNPRFHDDAGVVDTGIGYPCVDMGAYERQSDSPYVTVHVPGNFATIQEAIDAGLDGHEIVVAPGTYNEAIDLQGKAIWLHSSDGAEVTIIDAAGLSNSVIACNSAESRHTFVQGFTITGGEAQYDGGGMNVFQSNPTVIDCVFTGNSAGRGGGGMNVFQSNPTVIDCVFTGNSAGGDVYAGRGGGMYINDEGNVAVTNCTFTGNTAGHGGGMALSVTYSSPMVLTNCTFTGNSAKYFGGGLNNLFSSPTVTNCTFTGNTADIYDGGGMYNAGYPCNPTVTNCILWGDEPDEIVNSNSNPIVTYSDVQGGYSGTGNIDADPCFVDVNNPDPNLWNLRLQPDSPCIDEGDNNATYLPATDLDGLPRIIDGDCNEVDVVDMGAYEFNWHGVGDFDNNCFINFFDFSISARYWMTDESFVDIAPPGGDGIVDFQEVAIIADNWLASTMP